MTARLFQQTNDLASEFVRIMTGQEVPDGSDLSRSDSGGAYTMAWDMAETAQVRLCGVSRSSFHPEEHSAQFVQNAVVRYTDEFVNRRSGNPAAQHRLTERRGVVTALRNELAWVRWLGGKTVAAVPVIQTILTVVRMATADELQSLSKNGQPAQS